MLRATDLFMAFPHDTSKFLLAEQNPVPIFYALPKVHKLGTQS